MKYVADLHFIRKHILRELSLTKWARFRDLRPKNVDSNLYNYHLKQLMKDGFIEYVEGKGYRLSPSGLRYADHVSLESFEPRWQPKVLTELYTKNSKGEILMWRKYKQPFIGKWSLPGGKMHWEDESLSTAMQRELGYILGESPSDMKHIGIVEYKAFINNQLTSHTIAHIFQGVVDYKNIINDRLHWLKVENLETTDMSPGTELKIQAIRNHKDFFYEFHDVHW